MEVIKPLWLFVEWVHAGISGDAPVPGADQGVGKGRGHKQTKL